MLMSDCGVKVWTLTHIASDYNTVVAFDVKKNLLMKNLESLTQSQTAFGSKTDNCPDFCRAAGFIRQTYYRKVTIGLEFFSDEHATVIECVYFCQRSTPRGYANSLLILSSCSNEFLKSFIRRSSYTRSRILILKFAPNSITP